MSKILVSGLVNIEINVKVEAFPIKYSPVLYPFFGLKMNVSGVGMNVSKALKTLGSEITLAGMLANDFEGDIIRMALNREGIDTKFVLSRLSESPLTSILVDKTGRRQIHCDLKDIQDIEYPDEVMDHLIDDHEIIVFTPMNYNRRFLKKAKEQSKKIITDLHVINDLEDPYQIDFYKNSNIVFMSNEMLIGKEKEFMKNMMEKYDNDLLICGMGKDGSLLYDGKEFIRVNAVTIRDIVNTAGAGDSLFSCFLHYYAKGVDPLDALKKASYFAGYKIGEHGAALGFLSEEKLEQLMI